MATKERPARAALREWLAVPGRNQGVLAAGVGVAQQTISRLVNNGQEPSRELAKLIQEATGILWTGWFAKRQLERWAKQEARAKEFRARVEAARPPSSPGPV